MKQRKLSQNARPPASWVLALTPLQKSQWLGSGAKNPFAYPFSALAVGSLITGFNKALTPLLWRLFGCALWLAIDLWPLAMMFGIWIGNTSRFTAPRLKPFLGTMERRRVELSETRRATQKACKSICFACSCVLVTFLLLAATKYATKSKTAEDRAGLYLPLHASSADMNNDDSREATVTLSNQGGEKMIVLEVRCSINTLRTAGGSYINGLEFSHSAPFPLSAGGDGQAIDCPGEPPVFPEQVTCADITWDVFFTNESDLHYSDRQVFAQRKQFRFVLLNGHRMATDSTAGGGDGLFEDGEAWTVKG